MDMMTKMMVIMMFMTVNDGGDFAYHCEGDDGRDDDDGDGDDDDHDMLTQAALIRGVGRARRK